MKTQLVVIAFVSLSSATCAQHGNGLNHNFFGSLAMGNARPELYSDISFGNFDLLSANLKYSRDNSLQKVTFSPFKLMNASSIFNDSKINFTQKDGISTMGFAWGMDNTNPFNKLKHVKKAFEALPSIASKRAKNPGESDVDYAAYLSKYKKQMDILVINYMKALSRNSFSFLLGYNISLFEVIGGSKIKNADSLVANEYSVKAHSYSLDLNYGVNENIGFSAGLSYIKKRQSPVELQKMIDYYGFNVSASWRAIYLEGAEELKDDKDYLKSFFIPSIIVGVSFEYLKANGDPKYYEGGVKDQYVVTPYLDFKISTKSQFRLGLPVKKYNTIGKDQVRLGPFVQYSISIANTD